MSNRQLQTYLTIIQHIQQCTECNHGTIIHTYSNMRQTHCNQLPHLCVTFVGNVLSLDLAPGVFFSIFYI